MFIYGTTQIGHTDRDEMLLQYTAHTLETAPHQAMGERNRMLNCFAKGQN